MRWLFRLLASCALALPAVTACAGVAKPAAAIANPDSACVAPAEEMRRNHMEMLKHQRDKTLRLGERGAKISLNGCIDCHADKRTGSVLGRDGFCASCHAYAAVKLDCWDCHQPRAGHKAAAGAPMPAGFKP